MTAKSVKYPGKLGKPFRIPESEVMAALLADSGEKLTTTIEKLEKRKEMELLLELLKHYQIARDDDSRWFHLAKKLASTHVPAFRVPDRRPGRPRKPKQFTRLSDLLPRRKGAPEKWTAKLSRDLLELVRNICAAKGFQRRGAVTKALTEFISVYRKQVTSRNRTPREDDLNYLRKRYSEAKKKFPDLAR